MYSDNQKTTGSFYKPHFLPSFPLPAQLGLFPLTKCAKLAYCNLKHPTDAQLN